MSIHSLKDNPSASHCKVAGVVKTKIWIAISVYVLVAILKKRLGLGLEQSLYTILQILSVTLLEKMPHNQG